ncbi:hypothetical protein BDM02DRAFT_1889855 [Thelephora ganbajun]|uniref:Uncharacterized protein n=1 Tax=Thelephora ganbajun TaxID=370292 RepID=A0ACB6ZV54_THEGA|nr:hypothetical protein BDM02DRAFT_1889855 [Thelephora ganbajun]
MPWFKKSKKHRQPSQQPMYLGIPAHIDIGPPGTNADLAPDIGPEGVFCSAESSNRWSLSTCKDLKVGFACVCRVWWMLPKRAARNIWVVFRDRSGDRQLHASDASTPTHGREDGVTRACILLQLMGPMSMILIGLREREDPSTTPNEKRSRSAPDFSLTENQSEVQNQVKCKGRGTVTKRPPEVPPERTFGVSVPARTHMTLSSQGGLGVSVGAPVAS